jgi:hypothetical protein
MSQDAELLCLDEVSLFFAEMMVGRTSRRMLMQIKDPGKYV